MAAADVDRNVADLRSLAHAHRARKLGRCSLEFLALGLEFRQRVLSALGIVLADAIRRPEGPVLFVQDLAESLETRVGQSGFFLLVLVALSLRVVKCGLGVKLVPLSYGFVKQLLVPHCGFFGLW